MSNSFDINRINPVVLDEYRHQTDPIADQVITKIINSGFEAQINEVFMTIVRNHEFDKNTFSGLGDDLGAILFDYFESTHHLPEWADEALILQGEKVFATWGPEIFLLLNVSSLPLCYTCAKGAQVLYDTGRLLTHNENIDPLARRLMETAQMVVNVMSPGGLAPRGRGIVTIQKVRLIHASIRYYLKNQKHSTWDVSYFGEPINQEDLAGTLMSFGPVILSGLKQLGVDLSKEEKEAYMHAWKVVGYLMGIQPIFLPDTFEEGFDLASKILNHQAAKSEAGIALTNSCIQFVNHIVPGDNFNELPGFLMHTFLEEYSKAAKVDLDQCIGLTHDTNWAEGLVMRLTKTVIGSIDFFERSEFVNKISKHFNELLLKGIISYYNEGKNTHFLIPPSLKKNWKIEDN